jgi:hypothetical protein
VSEQPPDPAWRKLEPPLELTGNDQGTNLAIAAVNAFNLTAAATAPLFIFPRLELGGPLAWTLLVWVPLVFSTLFFGIPLFRKWSVARDNRRRAEGNLRKVLLASVFRTSLVPDGAQPLTVARATQEAAQALGKPVQSNEVEREVLELTADWDAAVAAGESGPEYRFHDVRAKVLAAEETRRALALETREVGGIVFSSRDTALQESERAGAAFDRELAGGGRGALPDGDPTRALSRYAPSDARAAYVDDFELVAFDEELRRGKPSRR